MIWFLIRRIAKNTQGGAGGGGRYTELCTVSLEEQSPHKIKLHPLIYFPDCLLALSVNCICLDQYFVFIEKKSQQVFSICKRNLFILLYNKNLFTFLNRTSDSQKENN